MAAPTASRVPDLKIVLMGAASVGKTSIVTRIVEDKFEEKISSTIGAGMYSKTYQGCFFSIWDTAGGDQWQVISKHYCRRAGGCLLVYDVTERESFDALPFYVNTLREATDIDECIVVVLGNKLDLVVDDPRRRQVTEVEGRQCAASLNAEFFEVSALSAANISRGFASLGDRFLASSAKQSIAETPVRTQLNSPVEKPPDGCAC